MDSGLWLNANREKIYQCGINCLTKLFIMKITLRNIQRPDKNATTVTVRLAEQQTDGFLARMTL